MPRASSEDHGDLPPIRSKTLAQEFEELRQRDEGLRANAQILELDPIIEQFSTWAVTEYGIECLTEQYPIPSNRVHEPDWELHMAEKGWVVMYDFLMALYAARRRWPLQAVGEA